MAPVQYDRQHNLMERCQIFVENIINTILGLSRECLARWSRAIVMARVVKHSLLILRAWLQTGTRSTLLTRKTTEFVGSIEWMARSR